MTQQLMAGAAKTIISPPTDCEMSGFVARQGECRGVHDPLWARAVVLSDSGAKLALISVDLIGVDRRLVGAIREIVARTSDVPPSSVIVCATHTHSGPAVLRNAYLGHTQPEYLAGLAQSIAGAVREASQSMEPVEIFAGQGECMEVGKNRRHKGGSTDPQVTVMRIQGVDRVIALVVNYACHPVVLGPDNLLITADYPYYMVRALEQAYSGAQVMMVNGACGDINVGHNTSDSIKGNANSKRTFEEAERLGRLLAEEALKASEGARQLRPSGIACDLKEICLPLEPMPTLVDLEQQAEQWQSAGCELKEKGAPYGEYHQAEVWSEWAQDMARRIRRGESLPSVMTEITAFSIGDLDFVSLPGEFFHEFALQIKRQRSPRMVLVAGYCNDNIGYVATEHCYDEGGYEVEDSYRYYGYPSRLARGSGEMVVNKLLAMLRAV